MHFVYREINPFVLLDPKHSAEALLFDIGEPTQLDLYLDNNWEAIELVDRALRYIENMHQLVEIIRSRNPTWRIFLLSNSWWLPFKDSIARIKFNDVLYTEFFLYRTYNEIIKKQRSQIAYRWNSKSSNFLFLMFVPCKFNRIRLLSKFVNNNLINNCEWSFFMSDNSVAQASTHSVVPEMSVTEFCEFQKKYTKNPDNITATLYDQAFVSYGGIPYNVELFTNTSFSVISETGFSTTTNPWVTEKTWKAILNQHPFIIAGDTNTLDKLHRMGFVTFEKFLPHSDYDREFDNEHRLDMIVDNTKYWIDNISSDSIEIDQAVSYNKKRMIYYYQQTTNQIQDFVNRNQTYLSAEDLLLTSERPKKIYSSRQEINLQLTESEFLTFYNNIKDSNWPDINSESDFSSLPTEIQRECIELFGYVVKNI